MKKIHFFLVVLSFTLIAISCDKIEGPYTEQQSEPAECDTPNFPAISNNIQKVLLEDFTGHTCINCPQGHKIAADLKIKYGDSIVLLAIHEGSFAEPLALPSKYTADYRTEAGKEIHDAFVPSYYPCGMINRKEYNSSIIIDKNDWTIAYAAVDRTNPTMALQVINEYNTSTNKMCTYVKTTFLQNTQKNLKLSLLIIEDSIVSPQKNNTPSLGTTPDIDNYVHRHILRGAVNSAFGDVIANSSTLILANTSKINGYSFSFAGKPLRPNYCSVIAIVYNVDTKEVVQVEESHVVH